MTAALLFAVPLAIGGVTPVTGALLEGLPNATARLLAHGKTQTCEGPLLRDVVAKLGAPQGEAIRGPALGYAILISARDGYRVVFSLGELDAQLGASEAIVATRCDGKSLSKDDGPFRLVVPGEIRAARSVRQVATITFVDGATVGN